jgi:predicted nucleic acid-binding protein
MIFVDTSVWIAVQRRATSNDAGALRSLLDADLVEVALPVRLEMLSGVAARDRRAFQRAFSALPVAYPDEGTWQRMNEWIPRAADAGYRFAFSDLLIAALADERAAMVWSLDRDFEDMEKVGLVQLYSPPS